MNTSATMLHTAAGPLHLRTAGSGDPVLAVHGILSSSASFDALLRAVPPGRSLAAVDLPGFGASPPGTAPPSWSTYATAVRAAVDALGWSRYALVGHSMGGGVAALVAAGDPRVDRLVLVDAQVGAVRRPLKARIPLWPVAGDIAFRYLYGERLFFSYFANDVFWDASRMDRQRVAAYYAVFHKRRALFLRAVRATADTAAPSAALAHIRCPTLLVWGKYDRLIPVDVAHRARESLSDAAVHVLPDCGHAPIEERPDETAAVVWKFLETTGPESASPA